jgi:tetratricopeptide (TPR) repeat protein
MRKSLNTVLLVLLLALTVFLTSVVANEKTDDPERAKILEKVKALLLESDSYSAIEFLHTQGKPAIVSKRYSDLVNDLYWKEKNLPHVVTVARAGIQYSLTKARELAETDSSLALELRGRAKEISYNLASYTWPGWDEPGIDITGADLEVGLDAARLNLRLAKELGRGKLALSVAHWVLGSQYLAAREFEDALEEFKESTKTAREAEERAYELLAYGYEGMVRVIEGMHTQEGQRQLDEAVRDLKKLGTDDAKFFATQLETVPEVFATK